jgi:uncharacterized membrane protein YoaK (UPF0700 family)
MSQVTQPEPGADQAAVKARQDRALVPLLLGMTVVSGAVDAVSILRLGHVFVANMTGNVVFLGFALARAPGFSVTASLVALGAFLVGAAVGGRVLPSSDRTATVGRTALAEAVLAGAATVVALAMSGTAAHYAMTVLLALALGAQNANVRRVAVPDLTTTVLTLTLTGLASDASTRSLRHPATRRRLGAVVGMLLGAIGGALLVLHTSTEATLGVVTAVLLGVAAATAIRRRRTD